MTAATSDESPSGGPDPAAQSEPRRRDAAAARAAITTKLENEAHERGVPVDEVRSEYYRRIAGSSGHTRRIQTIERRIREMRETPPPLTPRQIARLRAILAELDAGPGAA